MTYRDPGLWWVLAASPSLSKKLVKIKWDTLLCSYPFLRKDNIKEPPWSCLTIRRTNNWTTSTSSPDVLWWTKRRCSRLKNHIWENWIYGVFLNIWPSAGRYYKNVRRDPVGHWGRIRTISNCFQSGLYLAGVQPPYLYPRIRVCYWAN